MNRYNERLLSDIRDEIDATMSLIDSANSSLDKAAQGLISLEDKLSTLETDVDKEIEDAKGSANA